MPFKKILEYQCLEWEREPTFSKRAKNKLISLLLHHKHRTYNIFLQDENTGSVYKEKEIRKELEL